MCFDSIIIYNTFLIYSSLGLAGTTHYKCKSIAVSNCSIFSFTHTFPFLQTKNDMQLHVVMI